MRSSPGRRSVLICPQCEGRRQTMAFVDYAPPNQARSGPKLIPCSMCRGAGEITEEHAARIEAGKARKADRRARGLTLSQEARRLDISPKALCDIEQGRAEG